MTSMNRQITLANRPRGVPRESDFRLVETPVPTPKADEMLVRSSFLSVDPYMRILMDEDVVKGIENAPGAFIGMLQGKNIGKQLVQITEL